MALDHFIPQVYLRQWHSAERDYKQVLVTRKRDLHEFPANTRSIFRLEHGNTNEYFDEPRLVEEFLKDIEPFYSRALSIFRDGNITSNEVYVVAGLIVYIMNCSPVGVRLAREHLDGLLAAEIAVLDRAGAFPPSPDDLSNKTVTQLFHEGAIVATIDHKYPQSIGIELLTTMIAYLVDTKWQVVYIKTGNSHFLTSDYPVPILIPVNWDPVTRIFPLSPDIAVIIKGRDKKIGEKAKSVSFANFGYNRYEASPELVRRMNDLIVKAADELVISNGRPEWLRQFIKNRMRYQLKNEVIRTRTPRGERIQSAIRYVRSNS